LNQRLQGDVLGLPVLVYLKCLEKQKGHFINVLFVKLVRFFHSFVELIIGTVIFVN